MATSLKEMTALNQFPQTEKLFKSIPPAPTGYLGPAETATSDVEMMQAKDLARENVGKADIGIEQARRDEKTADLTSQAELEAEFAERRKNMPEMAALKEGREKLRGMEFVPTKDTVQDIAGLFSLIGVIGMAVGGGGRMASQQAMGAMNGMMEGHRKGRADLFKKEQIEFDKNFKAMQTAVSSLKDEYSEALEIEKTDKEAGRIARAMALNKAGSPVLKAMEAKQGAVNVMNTINDLDKSVKTSVTQYNTLKAKSDAEAAAERRHREAMAQRDRLARERMSHAEKIKGLGTIGRPASATNERYANTVYRSSNEVLRSLELIEQIGISTGGGALGTVVGKGTIPSEVQRYLGQLMTDEQQRNYNTAMSGIALEMAYVLGGGYKPDVTTTNKLETLLSVGPNDTPANAAYKFADITAKLKAAIEVSPAYTDEQKKSKKMIEEKMDRYATPEEVYQRVYGNIGKSEEPVVRSGKVYEPQTDEDFSDVPGGQLYKDPADGKIYRKRK